MFVLKIISLIMLFFSDLFILYGGLKYNTSSGDPKFVEEAKKQIIYGFTLNIISMVILISIPLYNGIHFSAYSGFDWFFFYSFISSSGVLILSIIIYQINHLFLYKKIKNEFFFKVDSVITAISMISFFVTWLSVQLYSIFLNF